MLEVDSLTEQCRLGTFDTGDGCQLSCVLQLRGLIAVQPLFLSEPYIIMQHPSNLRLSLAGASRHSNLVPEGSCLPGRRCGAAIRPQCVVLRRRLRCSHPCRAVTAEKPVSVELALRTPFAAKLQLAKAYHQKHGCLPHSQGPHERQPELARFITHVRDQHNRGVLSKRAVQALNEAFGDEWKVKKAAARFALMFKCLQRFIGVHGSLPSPTSPAFQGVKLYSWVANMKFRYQTGRLGHDQMAVLEGLPGWVWSNDQTFAANLEILKEFARDTGRLPKAKGSHNGVRIGNWMITCRAKYHEGKLPAEQIQALESIPGWVWRVERAVTFARGLQALQAFVQAQGRLPTRQDPCSQHASFNLTNWVKRQRHKQKRGLLSAQEVEALEGVPGWDWGCRVLTFQECLEVLQSYVQVHGKLPPARDAGIDKRVHIGRWVERRRGLGRRGLLAADARALLETVPGWWWEKASKGQVLGAVEKVPV